MILLITNGVACTAFLLVFAQSFEYRLRSEQQQSIACQCKRLLPFWGILSFEYSIQARCECFVVLQLLFSYLGFALFLFG